jgi:uncharacterized protein (DUF1501 family)
MSHRCSRNFWDRREFLFRSGGGISGLALAYLLDRQGLLAGEQPAPPSSDGCGAAAVGVNPYAAKPPHFKPRATAVISLFMGGGWSQVDTFDPKPALAKYAGEPIDGKVQGDVIVRQGFPGPLMPSPFTFAKCGQSGIEVSDLFPHLRRQVDEFAFLRSVYGRSNDHVQGTYEMQTGQINLGFPSVGSWVTYGLGSVASSLPAYVVMTDARGGPLGGPNDWSAGFIPAAYQGTQFRSTGDPIVDLKPPAGMTADSQRARLDALAKLNELDMQKFPGNSELAARISSYELAYRMQGCAPGAVDVSRESAATKTLYGLDEKISEPFGRQCLMARRLVERGVRFVQIFAGGVGNQNADTWDAHDDIRANHTQHAAETDRPMAGLLADLKSRGLLDSTLVIMHSEFGRMPISQRGVGRDHNPGAQTVLMAGAGITGGQVIGSSDEFGFRAMEQPISYHDLHATMLHLLGLDHTKLTYRSNGRDMRLTDVYGTLVPQIVA